MKKIETVAVLMTLILHEKGVLIRRNFIFRFTGESLLVGN